MQEQNILYLSLLGIERNKCIFDILTFFRNMYPVSDSQYSIHMFKKQKKATFLRVLLKSSHP